MEEQMEDARSASSECTSGRKRHLDELENNSSSGSSMEEDTDEDLSSESESENEELNSLRLTRLIDVFSVQFVDYEKEKEKLAETYGTILLDSHWKTPYVFFQRLPGDPLPPIDIESFLKLTGPSTFHNALDCIFFSACLTELDGYFNEDLGLVWEGAKHTCETKVNMLLSSKFDTKFGHVQVDYAVLSLCVEAVLEVKLLDWKDKGKYETIELFGAVTAGTKWLISANDKANDKARSCMFKREKDDCALVRRGEEIPLSRRCIPFLCKSSIVLEVDLRHPDEEGADQLIIYCSVEVPFAERGKEIVLDGISARIQLKVTLC